MIVATIITNDGKRFLHTFNTKRVKTVYNACRKNLGKAKRNSIVGEHVCWNFENGKVIISGYCHYGNRQDTSRMRKDARG